MSNYDLTGGDPSKPYPIEGNYVLNPDPDMGVESETVVTQEDAGNVANHFGQVKYAVREGATSIYKDETRNTANDNEASTKTENSCLGDVYYNEDETQGGAK